MMPAYWLVRDEIPCVDRLMLPASHPLTGIGTCSHAMLSLCAPGMSWADSGPMPTGGLRDLPVSEAGP